MLKKQKCHNAQVTEGTAKSLCGRGLRARSRSELRAGERLWSDRNGPAVPPKQPVLGAGARMPVIPTSGSRRNCATHSGKLGHTALQDNNKTFIQVFYFTQDKMIYL